MHCGKIETEPARFPTHAFVASAKPIADGTRFSTKIPPDNPRPVICQNRNRTTQARALGRMTEASCSVLNPASSFGLYFCCFKRLLVHKKNQVRYCLSYGSPKNNCFKTLLVRNKINDDIVFPMDHEKMFQKSSDSQKNQ
jgi:hypothetical protein